MLQFRRLYDRTASGGEAFYWANADGTAGEQLGQPGYTVRTTPALIREAGGASWDLPCWRAQTDDLILMSGVTRSVAIAVCQEDCSEGRVDG
jgi:hypothetical protein